MLRDVQFVPDTMLSSICEFAFPMFPAGLCGRLADAVADNAEAVEGGAVDEVLERAEEDVVEWVLSLEDISSCRACLVVTFGTLSFALDPLTRGCVVVGDESWRRTRRGRN